MEEIIVMKGPGNQLLPATQEDAEKIAKYKMGKGIRVKTTQMHDHNYLFHKKLFVLATYCYEIFCERVDTGVDYEWRGRRIKVKPSFDRFREDMTIMAGHFDATYGIDGSVRFEAKSWSYGSMDDTQKDRLYNDLINTALRLLHKYQQGMSREQLDGIIANIMALDG